MIDPEELDDVDAVLAAMIKQQDDIKPLRGVEALAVNAIIGIHHCGQATLEVASRVQHIYPERAKKIAEVGQDQLRQARALMSQFILERKVEQ